MLVFFKYNLRAINYDFSVLKPVPKGVHLPNGPQPASLTTDSIDAVETEDESETEESDSDELESLHLESESE